MGILKISNEMCLTQPKLVQQCIDWLKSNHNAIVHSKTPARHEMIYEISGDGIPDGNFHLEVKEVVPGVVSIKIDQ